MRVGLAPQQVRALFYDGHLAAEAPEHLCEFESDITPADHHQMWRHNLQLENRRVGEVRYPVQTKHIWNDGAAADIEEDFIGGEESVADTQFARRLKTCVALENR